MPRSRSQGCDGRKAVVGSRSLGSNPADGEILFEAKRRFIAHGLSCLPYHCPDMNEIRLKCK